MPIIRPMAAVLEFFHDFLAPLAGDANAWGWAIVLLTIVVRLLILPLAIKQTKSMRAMQELSPQLKKIQEKYKTDRSMMRTDPKKFQERRQKQQEEMMKLYQERGVNPAASCLPLLLQMPVFIALFWTLQGDAVTELAQGSFYFVAQDLTVLGRNAGMGAIILIVFMAGTMFISQRQMMARNPAATQQPAQKVLLYVMPVMLGVFGFNMPVGVVLYWCISNLWTMGQQWYLFRDITPPQEDTQKA